MECLYKEIDSAFGVGSDSSLSSPSPGTHLWCYAMLIGVYLHWSAAIMIAANEWGAKDSMQLCSAGCHPSRTERIAHKHTERAACISLARSLAAFIHPYIQARAVGVYAGSFSLPVLFIGIVAFDVHQNPPHTRWIIFALQFTSGYCGWILMKQLTNSAERTNPVGLLMWRRRSLARSRLRVSSAAEIAHAE